MKILSIGNSFSHDAHRYLNGIAKKEGADIQTVNLFIGGCSLETHYRNYINDLAVYDYEKNGGESSGKISIKEALNEREWDVVTLQQASHLSMKSETYFPFIEELDKFVRASLPDSKVFVHQTWAYDNGSDRLISVGYPSADKMFEDVEKCYYSAARAINADGMIFCGEAMLKALNYGINVYRDGFHAGLGAGRFLLGLVWYKALTGKTVKEDSFVAFDEPIPENERKLLIEIANDSGRQI